MDYACGVGADLSVGVDVGHYVVADFLFSCLCNGEVDVVDVGFKLGYLLGGDVQSQLHFRSGKGYPKAAEGAELFLLGEYVLHFLAGIAGAEGAFVGVVIF